MNWWERDDREWFQGWRIKGAKDMQRRKLYRAEGALAQDRVKVGDGTVQACRKYLVKVASYAWFKRRWPRFDAKRLSVTDGRARRSACAIRALLEIRLPVWARTKLTCLHELAHLLVGGRHPAHGRKYARTYLDLVRYAMGADAAAILEASYKKHGVKFKPFRRPMSTAQKVAACQRLGGDPWTGLVGTKMTSEVVDTIRKAIEDAREDGLKTGRGQKWSQEGWVSK